MLEPLHFGIRIMAKYAVPREFWSHDTLTAGLSRKNVLLALSLATISGADQVLPSSLEYHIETALSLNGQLGSATTL